MTVYNRHISYSYSRNASGFKTVNSVTDSWPTAMIQIAATWTHRNGNVQSQPRVGGRWGSVSASGTWLFGIAVGGVQIGSTVNETWTLSVSP